MSFDGHVFRHFALHGHFYRMLRQHNHPLLFFALTFFNKGEAMKEQK